MGVNAYSNNLPIRESRNTYVPLPFQEMYAAMQEKQKRYDAADAMEREAKKSVSALSTPIKGHNEYLEKKKQEYLTQALQMHSSMPDKGSAEYKRKSQDLIDGFVADPNVNLISASAQEWIKGREVASKLMVDGKYSTYQDRYNLNFNGMDPTTGALQRYNFIGLKPKVDYMKIMESAEKATPKQSVDITRSFPDGSVIRKKNVIKSAKAIEGNVLTALSMDPDAIPEMATDLNLDSKGIKQYLKVFAAGRQEIESIDESKFDAGTATYFDKKRKEEETAVAVPLSTVPNTTFRDTQDQLKSYIDDKGNFIPAKVEGKVSPITDFGLAPGAGYIYTDNGLRGKSKEERLSQSVTQVERLIREKHKDVYDNFLHARRGNKELALKDAISYIQEQKEGTPTYGTTIDDDDQRANIKEAMYGNSNAVMLYSLDPKNKEGGKQLSSILNEDTKESDFHIGAKLTASPYGRDANTGMALQSYSINIKGTPYIATLGSLNPRDEQSQALYDVEKLGKTTIIYNFEPDPENYPELGNRRIAKYKVYLNRLSNGQYSVCGDDISGQ